MSEREREREREDCRKRLIVLVVKNWKDFRFRNSPFAGIGKIFSSDRILIRSLAPVPAPVTFNMTKDGGGQCDQIGLFLKSLHTIFPTKVAQISVEFWRYI